MQSISASSVRTPPAALTLMCGDTVARINVMSSSVAPLGGVAGRRLDVGGTGGFRRPTAGDLLLVGEEAVLEDHLDDRRVAGRGHDRGDVVGDLVDETRAQQPDLQHHVELDGALLDRPLGLEHLRRREVGAVRKADDGADEHVGAGEGVAAADDVDRAAAHRGDVVAGGELATGEHVVDGELGLEQRVVDRLGDARHGDRLGGVVLGDGHGSPFSSRTSLTPATRLASFWRAAQRAVCDSPQSGAKASRSAGACFRQSRTRSAITSGGST